MNSDKPDLILTAQRTYMGHTFEAGTIFSIKFRNEKRNAFTIYQNGGQRNQLNPNMTPEWTRALEEGKNYYLAFFNPKWNTEHFFIREVDPDDQIAVNVEKPDSDVVFLVDELA
jgi:hypothetical protein